MRTPLSKGAVIPLNGREYHIDDVIGEGASCFVYDVSVRNTSGITYRYRLKECCPYNAQCRRVGNQIVWEDEGQRQAAFDRFTKAAQVIADLRSQESLGNDITETELCEGNGTLYAVMSVNHAKTYSFDDSKDLHRILQTMLKLTRIVGRLHEQGYLHLDIKPDNFLVHYDPDPNIWLFDVDSLVPIADLQSGRTTCYSYSKEWAAPELSQGKLSKVCPATDLFSIGAILFSKIMGCSVSNDDMGLFAEWDFSGEMFDNVNPKIKRLLRNIFQKTLAVSVKRRYQSTGELETALAKAVQAVSGVPFIQTESISSTINFVGRDDELVEIDRAFINGKHAVILHGFSGLGKSELAKIYAQRSRKYDIILLIRYGKEYTSISEWLENIHIENYEAMGTEKVQKAKALFDENTLIILDNFNIKPNADNGLFDLLRTRAKVLVTTTTDFSDIFRNNAQQIEIGSLSTDQLTQLFESNSGIKIDKSNSPIFLKLLKAIEYHTYFVDLLARQMCLSASTLDELYREVQTGIATSNNPTYVQSTKDDCWNEDSVASIMRVLFRIANLSEGQQQVLRNMCLLSFVKMTRSAYIEITGNKNLNDFNSLVRLGYIQESSGTFTTHSLLNDLIRQDMMPCWDNCTSVFSYVFHMVDWFDQYGEFSMADQDEADNKGAFLYRFFLAIDLSQEENVKLCLKWVHHLFESDFFIADVANPNIRFLQIFSLLDNTAQETNPKLRFDIYFILFKVWLRHCTYCSVVQEDDDYKELSMRQQMAIKYFNLALASTECFDKSSAQECEKDIYVEIACIVDETSAGRRMIEEVCPHITSNDRFLIEPGIPAELVRRAYFIYPGCFKLHTWDKKYYGIPLSEEDLNEESYFIDAWGTEESEDNEWLRKVETIADDLQNSADKARFINELRDSIQYDASQKVYVLEFLLDRIFDSILVTKSKKNAEKTKQYISETNWHLAEKILDIERDIILDNSDFAWNEADEEYISHIPKYRATLALIFDYDSFDAWMMRVNDVDAEYASYKISVDFGNSLYEVATACWNLGKCRRVLPYLIEALNEQLPDHEGSREDYDESLRECYDMISTIALYALHASEEVKDAEEQESYLNIHKQYTAIMDRITGKTYEIRDDNDV